MIPDILIHRTPRDRLESILKEGLKCGMKRSSSGTLHKSGALYFIMAESFLEMDSQDSFEDMVTLYIDSKEFKGKLKPDPEWRSYDNHDPSHRDDDIAWFLMEDVSPKFISLLSPKGYKEPKHPYE